MLMLARGKHPINTEKGKNQLKFYKRYQETKWNIK